MIHPKLSRFINLERMEVIYQTMLTIDLDSLKRDDFYYITGAMDGIMALIGINNKIAQLSDVSDEVSEEEKRELLKELLVRNNPEAIKLVFNEKDVPESPIKDINTSIN